MPWRAFVVLNTDKMLIMAIVNVSLNALTGICCFKRDERSKGNTSLTSSLNALTGICCFKPKAHALQIALYNKGLNALTGICCFKHNLYWLPRRRLARGIRLNALTGICCFKQNECSVPEEQWLVSMPWRAFVVLNGSDIESAECTEVSLNALTGICCFKLLSCGGNLSWYLSQCPDGHLLF